MEVKEAHSLNAPHFSLSPPILVTVFGMVMPVKALHLKNVPALISVTSPAKTTVPAPSSKVWSMIPAAPVKLVYVSNLVTFSVAV